MSGYFFKAEILAVVCVRVNKAVVFIGLVFLVTQTTVFFYSLCEIHTRSRDNRRVADYGDSVLCKELSVILSAVRYDNVIFGFVLTEKLYNTVSSFCGGVYIAAFDGFHIIGIVDACICKSIELFIVCHSLSFADCSVACLNIH